MDVIDRIEQLFETRGRRPCRYGSSPVSALDHALQCAQLAEWGLAPDALVAAALLHDLGHLVEPSHRGPDLDNLHELRAVAFLHDAFEADVLEPIRLHVQAKRYLVAADPHYVAELSPRSIRLLGLQGGPMTDDERRRFECEPHGADAVALRRWDDLARRPLHRTPGFDHFRPLLRALLRAAARTPTLRPLVAQAA